MKTQHLAALAALVLVAAAATAGAAPPPLAVECAAFPPGAMAQERLIQRWVNEGRTSFVVRPGTTPSVCAWRGAGASVAPLPVVDSTKGYKPL